MTILSCQLGDHSDDRSRLSPKGFTTHPRNQSSKRRVLALALPCRRNAVRDVLGQEHTGGVDGMFGSPKIEVNYVLEEEGNTGVVKLPT